MAETPIKQQHVVIVGGGLIGLCTAHALLRDGHTVTIVEEEHLGAGAATGNAGELTPQMVAPLASPNTAKDVIKGVFTPSHYLSIAISKLPHLAFWGLDFILASGKKRTAHATAALAQFADGMLPALDRLTEAGIDTSGGGEGFLMTSSDEAVLVSSHRAYTERAAKGWGTAPGPIMRNEELHAFEPTLDPGITGGFMLPAERSLDPVTFVASLADDLTKRGVEMKIGLRGDRLTADGRGIICVDKQGREETVTGDKVIIAAGSYTTPILKKSGIKHKKVVSGKGYSFTVPVETMPKTLIHSKDRNAVIIPMNGRLRVVGIMEFDEQPRKFNRSRLDVLQKAASTVIQGADWDGRYEEWVGSRPMTSDGMPLLGKVKGRENVIVASGHNMHGLSLGPVTGEVVADLIAGRTPTSNGKPIDISPFAVKR